MKSNYKDTALHVATVALPVGVVVGAAIAAYDYLVNAVLWDHLRENLPVAALCFMPTVGMIVTGLILKLSRKTSTSMADEVVRAYHRDDAPLLARDIFPKVAASVATMGFGASAGMEGASKWLGGSIGSFIQTQLNRRSKWTVTHGMVKITMLAGAAAGIGAIFRAPLTGAIMGLESPFKKDLAHEALLHGLVASAASFATFAWLRNATPYFPLPFNYTLNARDLFFCIPIGIMAGLSSHAFLKTLQFFRDVRARMYPHYLLNYVAGGLMLTAIAYATYLFADDPATLQSGLPVANRLLNGGYPGAVIVVIFLAKILATAITFGMGGVGGLFVPSATIGAALGAFCDYYFPGSQPGVFTMLGIAAFTGASYNSLLFATVFIAEASGSPALVVPGIFTSVTAFIVSSGISNSPSQLQDRLHALTLKERDSEPKRIQA